MKLPVLASILLASSLCLDAHATVGNPLTLYVTPDAPVQGGDTIGFTFAGGTPLSLLYFFVSMNDGLTPLGEVTLEMSFPLTMIFGGHMSSEGLATGGIAIPGSGPIPGFSGLTVYLQGITVKSGGSDIIWQASNRESIMFY